MSQPDKVLAQIIKDRLNLSDGRIVLYDQNYRAPKDKGIYVVISTGQDTIISNVNKFNDVTNQQEQSVTMNTEYIIEITSQDTSAKLRRHEILMAIDSNEAINKMEENNIRIFRTKTIQDLSFVEARSSLHRYRIPVIINHIEIMKSDTSYYREYQKPEVLIDEQS